MAQQSDHDIEDVAELVANAIVVTLTVGLLETDVDEMRACRARNGPGVENHRLVEGY